MFQNPFSFEGRIRRTEYGLTLVIYIGVMFVLSAITGMFGAGGIIILLLALIPMVWFCWAQGAKRCHDLGRSGWFMLIPFYGLVMLFAEGDAGRNEYGADPKNPEHDANTALDAETLDGHMNTNA